MQSTYSKSPWTVEDNCTPLSVIFVSFFNKIMRYTIVFSKRKTIYTIRPYGNENFCDFIYAKC